MATVRWQQELSNGGSVIAVQCGKSLDDPVWWCGENAKNAFQVFYLVKRSSVDRSTARQLPEIVRLASGSSSLASFIFSICFKRLAYRFLSLSCTSVRRHLISTAYAAASLNSGSRKQRQDVPVLCSGRPGGYTHERTVLRR